MDTYDRLNLAERKAIDDLFDYRNSPNSLFAQLGSAIGTVPPPGVRCEAVANALAAWVCEARGILKQEEQHGNTETVETTKGDTGELRVESS